MKRAEAREKLFQKREPKTKTIEAFGVPHVLVEPSLPEIEEARRAAMMGEGGAFSQIHYQAALLIIMARDEDGERIYQQSDFGWITGNECGAEIDKLLRAVMDMDGTTSEMVDAALKKLAGTGGGGHSSPSVEPTAASPQS